MARLPSRVGVLRGGHGQLLQYVGGQTFDVFLVLIGAFGQSLTLPFLIFLQRSKP